MKKIALIILTLLFVGIGAQARQLVLSGVTSDEWDLDITLWLDDSGITAGYAFLPEAMLVVGWCETYSTNSGDLYRISLTEFENDGRVLGNYLIHLSDKGDGQLTFKDGVLTEVDADNATRTLALLQFTCKTITHDTPGEGPLHPATTDDLSDIYENIMPEDHGGFFEMMVNNDGSIIFDALYRPAGDGVASAANDVDRPGRLVGNVMEYPRVNDCNDTLRATFFRDFVVVETQQVSGSKHDCNPINAVFVKKSYSE